MANKNKKIPGKIYREFEADSDADLDRQIAEAGERAERREYWSTVRAIAEEAIKEHPDRNDDEERDQYVWESVDGSSYVIHTAQNLDVLRFTEHSDAWEEFGELDPSKAFAQMAFSAMRADVMDELQRLLDERADEED